ncbi:hypothetical protein OS191_02955 [Xanthomarina sp. F2636L]|nr:hypothetical protein [Xanthomarina sp. F2636L]
MKLLFYLSICLLSTSLCFSQKKDNSTYSTMYMTVKQYKNKYKVPLTKKDSLSFRVIHGDTMVQVSDFMRPKGNSVPYEYKDSTFLKYYEKVAFNHKKGVISDNTVMKYWKDDVKIFFSKSVAKKTKNDLMKFAEEISSQVDSLNIYEVNKVEDSNYIIYYFGDYEYESNLMNFKRSSNYQYWNGNNQIYKSAIKLDNEMYFNETLRLYELKKYFIQNLGYFNLIDDFKCESYFSNCYSSNKKLTPLDLELIKYHYSYGICKGTNLKTFQEQHQKAKETLEETGNKTMFFHPL